MAVTAMGKGIISGTMSDPVDEVNGVAGLKDWTWWSSQGNMVQCL